MSSEQSTCHFWCIISFFDHWFGSDASVCKEKQYDLKMTLTMQGMRVLDNACEIGIDKSERPMQLWKTLEQ